MGQWVGHHAELVWQSPDSLIFILHRACLCIYLQFYQDHAVRLAWWRLASDAGTRMQQELIGMTLIAGIFATVLYEAITPVSVLIAVLPPLWAAWALHDNILKAPIFWALIFMLPLKFPPFFPFKWII